MADEQLDDPQFAENEATRRIATLIGIDSKHLKIKANKQGDNSFLYVAQEVRNTLDLSRATDRLCLSGIGTATYGPGDYEIRQLEDSFPLIVLDKTPQQIVEALPSVGQKITY